MLAADKQQLQSSIQQKATALKEKEFNLHHSNFMAVGTQAAVLAGLDTLMLMEFNPTDDSGARIIQYSYYTVIVSALCANMIVLSKTMALSVLGAGLALRGPGGSMMTASEGLYEYRTSVFKTFGIGLTLTVGSVLLSVWLILHWENALICWLVTVWTMRRMLTDYQRVAKRFDFSESDTVDLSDLLIGPAIIRAAVPAVVSNVLLLGQSQSNSHPLEMGTTTTTTATSKKTLIQMAASNIFGRGRGKPSAQETKVKREGDIEGALEQEKLIQTTGPPSPQKYKRRKGAPSESLHL